MSQSDANEEMVLEDSTQNGNANAETHPKADPDMTDGAKSLIAMAGTLVPIDRQGSEVLGSGPSAAAASQKRSSSQAPTTPKQPASKKAKITSDGTARPVTPVTPKSSPPKKKATGITVKTENLDDSSKPDHQLLTPKTPSTKKRSPTKKKAADSDEPVSPTTVRDTPRKRAAPRGNLAAPRGIPTSWENADTADRLLVTMKDAGETWAAIREAWKNETGQETAGSTLPNRYNRIKVNMMHLKDGDDIHLLTAKREADAEVWATVASKLEKINSEKYPTAFLQKKFKEFEDQAAASNITIDALLEQRNAGLLNGNGNGGLATPEDEEDVAMGGNAIDAFVENGDGGEE